MKKIIILFALLMFGLKLLGSDYTHYSCNTKVRSDTDKYLRLHKMMIGAAYKNLIEVFL